MFVSLAKLTDFKIRSHHIVFGLACGALILLQLYCWRYPSDVIWYTPAILFYLKTGGGFIGFGTFLILIICNRRYFRPRHYLGATSVLCAAAGYTIMGFGTEYVAFIGKPQVYIQQAEIMFWMPAALFTAVAITNKYTKALYAVLFTGAVILFSMLIYTLGAPIDWPHLPQFSPALRTAILLVTATSWGYSGIRFLYLYRYTQSFFDRATGYSLIFAGVIAGMSFFPVWHPLWVIWQYGTALGYSAAAFGYAYFQRQKRTFEIKPFFMSFSLALLVPFITLTSGLAGLGAWQFGARALQEHSASISKTLQAINTTQDLHASMANTDARVFIYDSVDQLLANTDTLPFTITAANITSTSYAVPFSSVVRTYKPGQIPLYQLVTIIPMDANAGPDLIGPIAITSQVLPMMHLNVARVRLNALGFTFLVSLAIIGGLWQVIAMADTRIESQQESLQRTVATLKEAEQSREDLTNMIVHDLRSPLTAIVSNLQLLERTIDKGTPKRQSRPLTRALTASNRMGTMITDMLNISKMERGQLELLYADVHVQDLLSDRAITFEELAQKENKQLRQQLDICVDQHFINADGDLLRRVFDNLISNALRYTQSGGTVTLGATSKADCIEFHVQDTGVGIPAAQLPSIFRKFSQASLDTEQRRKGIGLGLAFCKLAIEAHGGKIWVESIVDEGTTFRFTVPYQPVNQQLSADPASAKSAPSESQLPPIQFPDTAETNQPIM